MLISVSSTWFEALDSRRVFWEKACLLMWQWQLPFLKKVEIWDQGSPNKGTRSSSMQEYIDTLLGKVGMVPEGFDLVRN